MAILLFIIILGVLVVVHELGHLFAAKMTGVRADEFGIGYPPKAITLFRWKETDFTLNWIPFGGFVKIFGENPDEESMSGPDSSKSFIHKRRPVQAFILVAGILCNILFAWLLISIGFMSGMPTPVGAGIGEVENAQLMITSVTPESPAAIEGLKGGDVIKAVKVGNDVPASLEASVVSDFIAAHPDSEITFDIMRGDESLSVGVTPKEGIVENKKAVGIGMDQVGTLKLSFIGAFIEGAKTTWALTKATVVGLGTFVSNAFQGNSDLSQVTGPVGIVGLVGDASQLGLIYLLSFTAFISINLAIINLVPFPALDGGRLLFVLIESIIRRPIAPKIANTANAIGFFILIALMLVVTTNDILRLF